MLQNFNRQNEVKERSGVNSQSLNSRIPQKQLNQNPHSANQQQISMLKKPDTFQSKNVMTFNDFQKHIQNLNYVNQVSQQCQATSTRSNQDERNGFHQYQQPLSNQNRQNIQQFSQNINNLDQKYGKQFNNSLQQDDQRAFQNAYSQNQQRAQKNCPLPPSQNSIQLDNSNKKKNIQSLSISNLVKNNHFLKSTSQSEQQIEQNTNNYIKSVNQGNSLQSQNNSQSASYLNNKQQMYSMQQEHQKQQTHISNRWLFTNQNPNIEKSQQSIPNNTEIQNIQNNMIHNGNLTSHQQSSQNTPREKLQFNQQNQKNSYFDFEGSQQQTQKNQASLYTSKNTQFIRNKEPQNFQSILQQQQQQNLNSQNNQQSFSNGVQQNNIFQKNDIDLPAETPKQKFFAKTQYNSINNKSSDNISNTNMVKRNSDKKVNIRNATPPDSTIRYKISNQNNMETPQCNFSSLTIKNDQFHQHLPVKNLTNQLKLESIDQESYYSYNPQERQVQSIKIETKMTPNQYESRNQNINQIVHDSENILNTSESKIKINEENTPINNKHKLRYKIDEFLQSRDLNYDSNLNNNNNLNNGTENSLSVEEHVDDSILDEKISRSMFKANPSQHIQQKVQYECITIKCQNCQQEQQLQLKKILESIKQSLNSHVSMNNFMRDNSYKNEVSEFSIINTQDQKKYNFSSSSTKNKNFQNNLVYDKLSIKEAKEQLSHDTTLNSLNENSQDPNKTIRQLNCLASATYLDLSKKSHENQRSSSSTCNLNSIKLKQNVFMKQNNDQEQNNQLHQINEQLKQQIKQLKQKIVQKDYELEFQQQKMDDMNTQIKTLTLKLQEIQQKYSLDQQIISTLEVENKKLLESITNIMTIKFKIS